jgi:hypothetical protein
LAKYPNFIRKIIYIGNPLYPAPVDVIQMKKITGSSKKVDRSEIGGKMRLIFLEATLKIIRCQDKVEWKLGVDTFYDDPLTNIHLSILGYERVLKKIKGLAPRWVALGGGGYNISNVARAWTLAWAIMNGIELKDQLPESFLREAAKMGVEERELREHPRARHDIQNKENKVEMERVVHYIKEAVFPKIKR